MTDIEIFIKFCFFFVLVPISVMAITTLVIAYLESK